MNIKFFIAAILALWCAGLNVSAQAQGEIRAGRAIHLSINGVPSEDKARFDGDYPVSDSGTVNLPYIGPIRAAGLKAEQLARSIQQTYQSEKIYTNPTVNVMVSTADTLLEEIVHVGGQVTRTGAVKFVQGLTLYQAVMQAGGATPFGSLRRVKVWSNGKMKQFDLTQGNSMAVPVKPGDTIEVPQKDIWGR
jgi:polysaccharide export outer membrane protein